MLTKYQTVYLGDSGLGFPPALYPNLTYTETTTQDPSDPTVNLTTVSAFPDFQFNTTSALLLGPLLVNSSFALLSITLPIINNTSGTDILGYLTTVADASSLFKVLESREGLYNTGEILLIGPESKENQFPVDDPSADGTNSPSKTALAADLVRFVLPPSGVAGQADRHPEYDSTGGPPFPLGDYPAALEAYYATNAAINNASSDLQTTNERGISVAVGYARPQTSLVDWVLLVEQSHSEAWEPVTRLRKILLACVFGTAGLILLVVLPMAHFSVLPITRLKEATMTSVAPPGYSDDGSVRSEVIEDGAESGDEEAGRSGSPASAKKKYGFIVRMRDLTTGRRRKSKAEKAEDMRRRAFKIPSKVQDKKHYVTDELTELTATFNEMSDELTQQYSRLEERVAERTRQLEVSKKAAEAANESKTLFIANLSHELKTPLNGILGMCAVCMGENDLDKIKKSLNVVYKSGDLLLHLLNDLLTFSKNQIGQSLSLEEREFSLSDIKIQLVNIFDKQVQDGKIHFSVKFIGSDVPDGQGQEVFGQTSPGTLAHRATSKAAPAYGPPGTGRLKDMRLWGDQHRILQVIINLVSNSLKFTPEYGKVQVRIKCLEEVEKEKPGDRDSRNSIASKTGSQARNSRTRDRVGSSSNNSVASRLPSASNSTKPMGTALLINPMDPRAASMHIQVRERAPTPPPAHAKTLLFLFEVEDTGPGISPALQERVFEPFVQGDLGLSKKYGGTGLGLSICSQLAGLMGGEITLDSTVGVGSTFKMRIPLKFVKERASSTASSSLPGSRTPSIMQVRDESLISQGRRSMENSPSKLAVDTDKPMNDDNKPRLVGLSAPFFASSPTTGSQRDQLAALDQVAASKTSSNKIRVLVAEDNLVNQEVVLRMLKLEDIYDVTVAKDGQEAYDIVKASMDNGNMYNLIFMDIQVSISILLRLIVLLTLSKMPNLDGLQSTRMIRSMGYAAPIVALTAFAEESNVKECMDSGMDMFLSKPIRRPALKQVLQKFAPIPEEADGESLGQKTSRDNSHDEGISPGGSPPPRQVGQDSPVVFNASKMNSTG